MTSVAQNRELHTFLLEALQGARKTLWIATADLKDMYVPWGRTYKPIPVVLADLVRRGVSVRLLHAKEPGPRFRADFDKCPELIESDLFERALCVRVHMKAVIADGTSAYVGSANITGAGLGAKNDDRRNFEAGIITREPALVRPLAEFFDQIFRGEFCRTCERRDVCPDPIV